MARPDIPSFSFMRESVGEQLLITWLMALWNGYAFPAEPFVRLSPAAAIIDSMYSLAIHRYGKMVSDTPLFAVPDIRAPCRLTAGHASCARLLEIPGGASIPA
jgi:hypothetical protein